MKYYYKIEKDGKIVQIGTQSFPIGEGTGQTALTEEEYNEISAEMQKHAEKRKEYFDQYISGEIEYDKIPEEYRAEVGEMAVIPLAEKVRDGELSLDDVPAELKDKVTEAIGNLPNNPYGIPNDEWNKLQAEAEQKAVDKVVAIANGTYVGE